MAMDDMSEFTVNSLLEDCHMTHEELLMKQTFQHPQFSEFSLKFSRLLKSGFDID
jgi:hypothetical protein